MQPIRVGESFFIVVLVAVAQHVTAHGQCEQIHWGVTKAMCKKCLL
jgi:hypothetical protein